MIMKTKVIVLSFVLTAAAGSVMAQENDDMYFNSKDRAKQNAQKTKEAAPVATLRETPAAEEETDVIPEESYSSRSTNPEFTSRSNSEVAQEDNEDYFVENYNYSSVEDFNNFNNRYNNWYNSPWYTNSYYAPSMYGWNSPYYNSYWSPWGGNPYSRAGWYGSFGYSWGSPYYGGYLGGNNAWDYGYGYGNPYYGSYYGYGNSWAYYGGGWNNYYNNWGGSNVIIVEGDGRGTVYGKRASRGGMVSNSNSANRTRSQIISNTDAGRRSTSGRSVSTATTTTSGRVATNGRSQDEYYNRGWRRASEQNAPTNSRSFTNPSPARNGGSNSRSSWGETNRNNSFTPAPSRSTSGSSFGSGNSGSSGGSRSSGSSSSGSSGGSRRGRD
jgi:hypothetical protein